LDDRTTGNEENAEGIGAAILSPTQISQPAYSGKTTRVTSEEVYQKEPLNIEGGSGNAKR